MGQAAGALALALGELQRRTRRELICLHVMQGPNSVFCFDINREFNSLDEFQGTISDILDGFDLDSILPSAPDEKWRLLLDPRIINDSLRLTVLPDIASYRVDAVKLLVVQVI